MDAFKTNQHKYCSVGGIHCPCCNSFTGKDKAKLNRLARRKMKRDDYKENKNEINY